MCFMLRTLCVLLLKNTALFLRQSLSFVWDYLLSWDGWPSDSRDLPAIAPYHPQWWDYKHIQ